MSVFISYSHKDSAFVDRLAIALIDKNIKVWKDGWKTLAGDSFVKKIQSGIEGASHFCLVLSQHARESKWVEREIKQALLQESKDDGIVILPIRIDDCTVPDSLSDRLYVDFRSDFDEGVKHIIAAVGPRYNRGDVGRINSESRYFLDYGIEERVIDGKYFMQLDVISYDIEETFSILSQFIFRGNEHATSEQFELGPEETLREFVLLACAQEFIANPARITLNVRESKHARFDIQDADGIGRFDIDVRIKWLGAPSRSSVLFDVGALFGQICETMGISA
ncbi:hypothetical protein C6A37_04505 [Desulfobacteraceae bacterium SEEP-SAG9]|nr:hypothetical protein C6A37_04505 [Desulfobacteraceae bacterium SEEP-SAG9]